MPGGPAPGSDLNSGRSEGRNGLSAASERQRQDRIPYPFIRLREAGGRVDFPGAWFSDEATAIRCALRGGVACSPLPCFRYRESRINLSTTSGSSTKLEAITAFEDWLLEVLSAMDAGDDPRIGNMLEAMPERLERMRYKFLLEPGLAGLPSAVGLVLGRGGRYRIGPWGLLTAGLMAVSTRLFARRSRPRAIR